EDDPQTRRRGRREVARPLRAPLLGRAGRLVYDVAEVERLPARRRRARSADVQDLGDAVDGLREVPAVLFQLEQVFVDLLRDRIDSERSALAHETRRKRDDSGGHDGNRLISSQSTSTMRRPASAAPIATAPLR